MRELLLLVAVAACDPQGPGVEGTLTLPGGAPSAFTTLELRFFPDIDGQFDLAGPPMLPTNKSDFVLRDRQDLSTIAFPYEYTIGKGVGTTDSKLWRVVLWLATPATQEWPNGSEPFATTEVTIGWCDGYDSYCGVTEGVDLTLQTPGTVR